MSSLQRGFIGKLFRFAEFEPLDDTQDITDTNFKMRFTVSKQRILRALKLQDHRAVDLIPLIHQRPDDLALILNFLAWQQAVEDGQADEQQMVSSEEITRRLQNLHAALRAPLLEYLYPKSQMAEEVRT